MTYAHKSSLDVHVPVQVQYLNLPTVTFKCFANFSMDGCMDNLRFYVCFNRTSGISGQWLSDNDRLESLVLKVMNVGRGVGMACQVHNNSGNQGL